MDMNSGIASAAAPNLGAMDKRMLAMAVLGQVPGVEPAAALGRLNKIAESEKMQAAMAGQQAMTQNAQMMQQPLVAQQVLAQALNSGIGAEPVGFADGGIVGGMGFGYADPVSYAEAMAGDESRIENQRELNRLAYPPNGQELQRIGMKYGIVLSPYDDERTRISKIQEIQRRNEAEKSMLTNRTETPVDPNLIKSPPARRRPDEALGSLVDAGKTPSLGAPPGPRSAPPPVSSRAKTQQPIAMAKPDETDEANKALEQALGATSVTPAKQSARDALRKRLEEIQQARMQRVGRMESDLQSRVGAKRPSGFQDPEFLFKLASALGGTKTLSEGFAKASENIGEYSAQRRREEAETARQMRQEGMELMKLRDATEDLKTALYEKEVAYASGDANAKREADINVAKARAEAARAKQDYELKKYQAESQRIAANASMVSARSRGEGGIGGVKPMNEYQRAEHRRKVEQDVDKNIAMLYQDYKVDARKNGVPPVGKTEFRQQMIDAKLAATPGYGVASTTPPDTGEKVYDFLKIGAK